jgi:hypothetical protein
MPTRGPMPSRTAAVALSSFALGALASKADVGYDQ